MKKSMLLMMGTTFAMLNLLGVTKVYVDKSANPAEADGTVEHPFVTIQDGVEDVDVGGTVYVAPGVYDQGETLGDSGCSNRVFITKNLTLQATSTCRTNTVIRGAYDMSATDGWYRGDAAVRCVEVKSGCTVYINGFTLEKSRTHGGTGGDNQNIGGVVFGSGSNKTFVQDCILRDGAARSGGAAHQARLIRCFVTECSSWNVGACMRSASAYNTIFARNATNPDQNRGAGLFAYSDEAVNCTVVENGSAFLVSNNGSAKNCAVFNNYNGVNQPAKCINCVSDDPSIVSEGTDNRWAAYSDCIYSPVQNDYRLLAGSACVGAGLGSGTYMSNTGAAKDFFGNDIDKSSVNVGAVQATAVAVGNPIFLDGSFAGSDLAASGLDTGDMDRFGSHPKMIMALSTMVTHFRRAVTPVYPDAVKIVLPSLPDSYGNIVVTNSANDIVSIGWDNTAWLPVCKTGVTNFLEKVTSSARAVWVDKNSTAEGEETGSADHPFRKLQDGVAKLGWYPGVVFVKRGDYDEGWATLTAENVTTHKCRLVFSNNARTRVVAVEGPDVTSIVGASDSDDPADGFGPNAVRCVAAYKNWNFVSGFTLRDSRVGAEQGDDTADKLVRRGGAAMRMYTDAPDQHKLFLTDCVITNCTGREGSIGWGVTFVRCRIMDSGRFNDTPYFVNSIVVSSTIRNCGPASGSLGSSTAVVGSGSALYNVSVGPTRASPVVTGGSKTVCNSVMATGLNDLDWNSRASAVKFSVYEASSVNDSDFIRGTGGLQEGLTKGKAAYRDVENGRFGLTTMSDGRGLANYDLMYKGCPIDVDGVPYVGSADGRFNAGASATVVRGVALETDWEGGISPSGARGFDDSGELELTAAAERPFLGFMINDETVVPANHGRTYTLRESELPEGPVTVRALYGTQFFVSPTGSDANNGFYEDTPFQHFTNAFERTLSSDEIVALPGDYGEELGSSLHDDSATVKSRVVVPAGRILRSRDGAATTRILGKSSVEDKEGMGLGPDAVRCAYLNANAKLIGFTLKGGRTDKVGNDDTVDTKGGGVLAAGSSAVVRECVFDDCASVRGGSAHSVSVVRSRFVNGKSPHYGGIFINNCQAYRCVFGSSYSPNAGASAVYNGRLESSTVCPDCCTTDASKPAAVTMSGSATVVNTIVANGGSVSANADNIKNCAFKTGTEEKVTGRSSSAPSVFGDVEVDANGLPVIGRNVGIDAADPSLMTASAQSDIAGCDHFWNGAWDIGAYEVDWRDHYARALSGSCLVVDDAPATAVEQTASRQVRLVEGTLKMSWRTRARGPVPMTLDCSVPGTGRLLVFLNDVQIGEVLAGQSSQIAYENPLATDRLAFAYEPGAEDALGALIGRLTGQAGVILLVR